LIIYYSNVTKFNRERDDKIIKLLYNILKHEKCSIDNLSIDYEINDSKREKYTSEDFTEPDLDKPICLAI
jgi:hypothetical protein